MGLFSPSVTFCKYWFQITGSGVNRGVPRHVLKRIKNRFFADSQPPRNLAEVQVSRNGALNVRKKRQYDCLNRFSESVPFQRIISSAPRVQRKNVKQERDYIF